MSDIDQIEISIKDAKDMVSARDALLKLKSNRDFKKIVLEGYFEKEAVRLVGLLAAPGMDAHKNLIVRDLEAISSLQSYFQSVLMIGDTAANSVAEYEAELEMLRQEEMEA
tara:strand:+ start:7285 stop:7617 length:333 start_codon:yes stop_codon:yes gene_type:complete